MLEMLRDLMGHEAWADGRLLRAVHDCQGAWEDVALSEKLHHIHAVQLAYLRLLQDEPVDWEELQRPFSSFEQFHTSISRYHKQAAALGNSLRSNELEKPVIFPIPGEDERRSSLGEALLQVVMHSHYHRAQIATRLRELSGQPPLTDFIIWIWDGKPSSQTES